MDLSGTLVVMVPSNRGLVVAADSRRTVAGQHCDNARKVVQLAQPPRSVVTVTGTGTFVAPPPADVEDICEYIRTTPPQLDVARLAKEHIEATRSNSPEEATVGLADACLTGVMQYSAMRPDALARFRGGELCSVVVARYDSDTCDTTVRRFPLRVSFIGSVEVGGYSERRVTQDDARDYLAFGETGYLNEHVFGGVGRQFLSSRVVSFLLEDARRVREIDVALAAGVAADIIRAASRTTDLVPPATGIGGPIDVLLLGDELQLDETPQ